MDEEGFIYFKQRIKRMIITSGYNVYPSQLENIIDSHESVKMSCVIGVKDDYKMQKIMSKICSIKGKDSESEKYEKKARETKNAIINKYIVDDHVDNDGQGALAEVLYFEIVGGTQAQKIADRLAQTLRKDDYICKVGILGMKALLNALSEYGYTEDAYKAITREDYPSYGYWRKLGATTFWESWRGEGIASLNHHMYGDVVHWLFRNIGGIRNEGVAYEKCRLAPYFFGEECFGKTKTQTPYGEIAFSWNKKKDIVVCEISVPKEIEAKLEIAGKVQKATNGKIEIVI